MTYSEKLKDPRWQKKRLSILDRDQWKCVVCRDDKSTLHVHHLRYSGNPWDAPDDDLTTLCERCHELEEIIKKDNPIIYSAALGMNVPCCKLFKLIIHIGFLYHHKQEEDVINVLNDKFRYVKALMGDYDDFINTVYTNGTNG